MKYSNVYVITVRRGRSVLLKEVYGVKEEAEARLAEVQSSYGDSYWVTMFQH